MALITCPECSAQVSDSAPSCPSCGHPFQPKHYEGPPTNCSVCGGPLIAGKEAKNGGSGCAFALIGLVLTPVIIGIPILLYGIHLGTKREGYWQCKNCKMRYPRQIGSFEWG